MPTLIAYPALHLVRFVVRSLDDFEIQKGSKVGTDDFILPMAFDGQARGLELAISRISGPWSVTNAQGMEPVQTYKIPLDDPNVSFHIADCIWHRGPMAKGITPFEIFRYDDPTNNFEFKNLKGSDQ